MWGMRSPETMTWNPDQLADPQGPAAACHIPIPPRCRLAVAQLSQLPPLVVSWEIEALRERMAGARSAAKQFLLQAGDCAESFAECESDRIAKQLKVILQVSLVLLHGLKRPIIRVGRMAGQYAKPRSADTETKDGVTLPSYRGDIINHPEFTPEAREPRIRSCCCAATSALRSRSISCAR